MADDKIQKPKRSLSGLEVKPVYTPDDLADTDFARDLGQNARGDMMDICVWEQTVGMYDRHGHNKLFVKMAVHQESDVVPENIDAVRAVMGSATAEESMNLTDRSLNLNKDSVYYDFARLR